MSTNYIPARIVEGAYRWYIVFYQTNPKTGKLVRFRQTFDLNRVPDPDERRNKADLHVKQINAKLPLGYPYEKQLSVSPGQTNIIQAIEITKQIKLQTDRKRTKDVVESMCRIFTEWIRNKGWGSMPIKDFTRKYAISFLDYVSIERKVSPTTYNNYIERMRALFNELKDREYIEKNPFSKMKKRRVTGKNRRAFSAQEMDIVAKEISKKDRWLFLGVLLQYHCFIRPVEMRRMKIYMIDLKEGLIRLPAHVTKNKENAIITIPNVLLPFLQEFGLEQYNKQWLLFGAGVEPHPDTCCGHNTMNWRHKQILSDLHQRGLLSNIEGLSFYSWKDTGVMQLFKSKVDPLEIMRQVRHKELNTTQKYCQSLYIINKEIQTLDNKLLVKGY